MAGTIKKPAGKTSPAKKSAAAGARAKSSSSKAASAKAEKKPAVEVKKDSKKAATKPNAIAKKPAAVGKTAPKRASTAAKPASKVAKAGAQAAMSTKTKPPAKTLAVARVGKELTEATAKWRSKNETIALVPTMGALHAGHFELVEKAKSVADRVVVSIFVNPTQFAPNEDLERYPRDEAGDLKRLGESGVDLIWAPSVEEMYPDGFTTRITPGSAANGLESDFRPHFFGGVATVVAKLFNQVRPNFAIFGEKDYQQLIVVTQLARDLDMGLTIVPVATVREKDGLAMSSRNAYLSGAERAAAPNLNLVLREVAHAAAGGASISHLKAAAQMRLLTLGFSKVDYVEVRDAATLGEYDSQSGRAGRVLGAAWLGQTRLIDNVNVEL